MIELKVVPAYTHADRQAAYRRRQGDVLRQNNAARMRKNRANKLPEFYGVDGEGIGKGKAHRYVLISLHNAQGEGAHYIAQDLHRGLQWYEVFEFLYAQFQLHPQAAFTGFYLGYDFDETLKTLPIEAARSLLTREGRAHRRIKGDAKRRQYNAVKVGGWEVDMMGKKRLSIRPRPHGCTCYEQAIKCTHKQLPWMHICDAGSFYQMSLLAVLDQKRWSDDPDGWPVTQAEYDIILRGKNRRDHARLDDEMLEYNQLENMVLARVMLRLAKGFAAVGIKLAKDQWYGPGATASKWLSQNGAPTRKRLRQKEGKTKALMPLWFWDCCHHSYFGGWFEIFSHGIMRSLSHNYDINNAYPYAATKLPHICGECGYKRGSGEYSGQGEYVLLYCTVFSNSDRIGPVPYRDKAGNILRPRVSKGWYWRHEIEAATRAGLVKKVITHEWSEFVPCAHKAPFTDIERLYYLRLEVGKDGAQGMAIKLNNNSIYGKFAQSVGGAPYNNWFYASYITSHCRTQILEAIASHPGGADSVLMVATDGICFDSPHPSLSISKKLGEWAHTTYDQLVLFKPGVYWHREGKEALLKVKSRGVPKDEFLAACEEAEMKFAAFSVMQQYPQHIVSRMEAGHIILEIGKVWPYFFVPVKFRMQSCLMALAQGKWDTAGTVLDELYLKQDSDPANKRRHPFWNAEKERIDTVIHDLPVRELQTYYHGEVELPKAKAMGFSFDGETAFAGILEAAGILRDKPANYDIPITDEMEWERVWG